MFVYKKEIFSALGIFLKFYICSSPLGFQNIKYKFLTKICKPHNCSNHSGIQCSADTVNGSIVFLRICHGAFEYLENILLKLPDNCLKGFLIC